MKILIITGGSEKEREISLWSAKEVKEALGKAGHITEMFDLLGGDEKLKAKLKDFDLAFPIIHGEEGEGGQLQKKLEDWGVKFLGPSSKTCFEGWDKFDFKKFCKDQDIRTPAWEKVKNINEITIKMPFVIKPSDDGSTVDIFVIKSEADLISPEIDEVFKRRGELMVEEFIDGVEVTSGIWGEKILPLIEIKAPDGELYDFENKYNGKSQEIPFAPSLSQEMQEKVDQVTKKIKTRLKIRDFSRIDYMVRGEEVFALELNTIPGMTSESLLPKAITAAGMSMEEALNQLISSST